PRGGILGYLSDCGTGNAICEPSWTWGTGNGAGPSVPITSLAISRNRLYAASGDGKLYVFGPGSVAAEHRSPPASSSAPTFVFYLGLVALGGLLFLVRRARRAS